MLRDVIRMYCLVQLDVGRQVYVTLELSIMSFSILSDIYAGILVAATGIK